MVRVTADGSEPTVAGERGGPSLVVTCRSGLANRLRVLSSGLALAEATGRTFQMLWPNDRDTCGAGFHELFDTDLPVVDLPARQIEQRIREEDWWFGDDVFGDLPDFLAHDVVELRCVYVSWLVDPERGPAHRGILDRAHEMLSTLQPNEEISSLIEASTAKLTQPAIGVHIRRGDFVSTRPEVVDNLDLAIKAVRDEMDRGARSIFLATDDGAGARLKTGTDKDPSTPSEGVRGAFRDAFGDAVIESQPRSLDRSSPVAVADAVVDLWILRSTDVVVGTAASSFSELAAVGRDVPHLAVGGAGRPVSSVHRSVIRLGLEPMVERLGRRIYGRDVAVSALIYRTGEPARRLAWRASAMVDRLRSKSSRSNS